MQIPLPIEKRTSTFFYLHAEGQSDECLQHQERIETIWFVQIKKAHISGVFYEETRVANASIAPECNRLRFKIEIWNDKDSGNISARRIPGSIVV